MTLEPSSQSRTTAEKQLEIATWGAFFVWIGVALLAHWDWGIWLVGVGAILLGAQAVRRMMSLRLEGFWIVAGAAFVLGGVSELFRLEMNIAVIPLLCILAGAALLARAVIHGRRPHHA